MNKKILEILSRATPANDTNQNFETDKPKYHNIRYSSFNRTNIAKNGNINIISLNGAVALIFFVLLFFIFFQQTF